jgi:hypothetical protein
VHHDLVTRGSVIKARGPAGGPCVAATYRHRLADYLRPALSLGFRVSRCEKPGAAQPAGPLPAPAAGIGERQDWPWSLMDYRRRRRELPAPIDSSTKVGAHRSIFMRALTRTTRQ